jgi:hypothetical protein
MDEIFDLVQRDIATAGYAGKLSAGIVLTGVPPRCRASWSSRAMCSALGRVGGAWRRNIGGLTDSGRGAAFRDGDGLAQYAAHRFALGATVWAGSGSP